MFSDPRFLKERDRRVAILNKLIADNDLDALLFTSTAQQAYQVATKYVTNYQLITRRNFVFMKPGEWPRLIVPTAGMNFHCKRLSWLPDDSIYFGNTPELIVSWLKELRPGARVGMYEVSELPGSWERLIEGTGAKIVDITYQYTVARQLKSDFEIEMIQKSSDLAVASFEEVVRHAEIGVTDRELVGIGEGYIRAHGGEDTLILSRCEHPHSFICRAGDYKMTKDTSYLYSAEVAGPFGFWTQVIRPIFFSRGCQPEVARIQSIIKEAELAGAEAMKIGNTVADVAIAIEKVVADAGCTTGIWSGHGMGHDLGDGVDIGNKNMMEIVPNMVLTLHPSVLSDKDGSLFGNTWYATPEGAKCFTPKYRDVFYLDDLKAMICK